MIDGIRRARGCGKGIPRLNATRNSLYVHTMIWRCEWDVVPPRISLHGGKTVYMKPFGIPGLVFP